MTDIIEETTESTIQDKENLEEIVSENLGAATIVAADEEESQFLLAKDDVVYHIGDFDGPLDLLLSLIRAAKIDIDDIFVSDVTHQYVEIIKNTPKEEFDYDYAGEFITMAAELVYLKSLRSIPISDDDPVFDDAEEQRNELINKIKEYALIQEKSEKLRKLETTNRFTRQPVFTDKDYRVSLTNFSLPKLVEAYARVLANADRHSQEIVPKKVVKDRFSVHEQMQNILTRIIDRKTLSFLELIDYDYDKNDIVTTFLAMLELMKYGRVTVNQDEIFGDITLFAVEGENSNEIVFEDGDDGKY